MDRFDVTTEYGYECSAWGTMERSEDGNWVRYEDAQEIISRLQDEIDRLMRVIRENAFEVPCTCEMDCHDFNCPTHNDAGPSRQGPNGDEDG